MKRKAFLKKLAWSNGFLLVSPMFEGWNNFFCNFMPESSEIHVEKLTTGPEKHWFGYYDKLQTDPSGRYILAMQTNFEGRTPMPEDKINIGMIDTARGNQWTQLGTSCAWGWQQGCMLQWLPGSDSEVIWNDRIDGSFASVIMNVFTGQKRHLPKPIYTVSPDGKWALGLDFARLQDLRPGYGYVGLKDRFFDEKAPANSGIYRIELSTGVHELIISHAKCAAIPYLGEDVSNYWHYYNHLLVSPDSERFIFLDRWLKTRDLAAKGSGFFTRMMTANRHGEDIHVIDPSGYTSHFIWKDAKNVTMWTRPIGQSWGFYTIEDKTTHFDSVGKGMMTHNGHITYIPHTDNEWILNDTYPLTDQRLQELYLYHIPTQTKVTLGKFHAPAAYRGEWRCDLHAKCTPDGKKVIFDSAHGGDGRQLYRIDIEPILANKQYN